MLKLPLFSWFFSERPAAPRRSRTPSPSSRTTRACSSSSRPTPTAPASSGNWNSLSAIALSSPSATPLSSPSPPRRSSATSCSPSKTCPSAPPAEQADARSRFHVKPGDFLVILLDQIGAVQIRSAAPVDIHELVASLDSLPARTLAGHLPRHPCGRVHSSLRKKEARTRPSFCPGEVNSTNYGDLFRDSTSSLGPLASRANAPRP